MIDSQWSVPPLACPPKEEEEEEERKRCIIILPAIYRVLISNLLVVAEPARNPFLAALCPECALATIVLAPQDATFLIVVGSERHRVIAHVVVVVVVVVMVFSARWSRSSFSFLAGLTCAIQAVFIPGKR